MNADEQEIQFRSIEVINDDAHLKFTGYSNSISTTKYTWYTWLPKSFWEQFRRIANAYFLGISILMLIGTYATYIFQSPLNPYSTLAVLAFVLLVTACKDGYEDLLRGRSDRFENNKDVTVITFEADGTITETVRKSETIAAGDIVKLTGKTPLPVDMLLILTSMHTEGNKCYIETANLDGETNLKLREAPALLYDTFATQIAEGKAVRELFSGTIECELPNKNMHVFVGTLKLQAAQDAIPLTAENLILRGSLFTNTDWAYGIAVYTGQETKIQMNNRLAPSKLSRLESYLNTAILIIFAAQITLVSFSVGSIYMLDFQHFGDLPYVYPNNEGDGSVIPYWLEHWFIFFLLYNNFIPISLYVTIEIVNLGQAYLIASDELMYKPELDVCCTVRASNLVQEIGMISHIFSDKTGTLTRNEMKLVKFVVNGVTYDIDKPVDKFESVESKMNEISLQESSEDKMQIIGISGLREKFGVNFEAINEFFRCLATCHTVIREKDGTYRAESPDELALVEGLGGYNCFLNQRGTKEMNISMYEEKKTFEILAVNPFNADRKRMSILLRDTSNPSDYYLMCKGADNIMIPLCSIESTEKEFLNKSLYDLSNMGLRTLCIAHKQLNEVQAMEWLAKFKAASISPIQRDSMMAQAAAEIESDMKLLGVTAIEDRLQDEVPEVIADLATAGIILWMLTGDKLETAINIGRSCNLILHDTVLYSLTGIESHSEFEMKLKEVHESISKELISKNAALLLDGISLTQFIDESPEQRAMLLKIGQSCRSVVACRLTPTQKRELVALVKKDTVPKATTLAIGDGANDVSMILEGDVGVGIFGKEGRQAANNADFALGEFKFLRRLLLVHGRWNYVRQSKTFLYCMHKNMVITLTLFWFSYYSAVSGTTLYESWVYSSFNVVLGVPILVYGIIDRDISADFSILHPQTYITGQSNTYLKISSIALWIFNAILYTIVLCLFCYLTLAPTFQYTDLYTAGTLVFVAMCTALQCKVSLLYHQWTRIHVFWLFLSVLGMMVYFLLIAISVNDYYYVAQNTYSLPIFWFFGYFTIPLAAIMIDMIGYNMYLIFFPTKENLFRELELKDKFTAEWISTQGLCSSKKTVSDVYPVHSPNAIVSKSSPSPSPNPKTRVIKTGFVHSKRDLIDEEIQRSEKDPSGLNATGVSGEWTTANNSLLSTQPYSNTFKQKNVYESVESDRVELHDIYGE